MTGLISTAIWGQPAYDRRTIRPRSPHQRMSGACGIMTGCHVVRSTAPVATGIGRPSRPSHGRHIGKSDPGNRSDHGTRQQTCGDTSQTSSPGLHPMLVGGEEGVTVSRQTHRVGPKRRLALSPPRTRRPQGPSEAPEDWSDPGLDRAPLPDEQAVATRATARGPERRAQ